MSESGSNISKGSVIKAQTAASLRIPIYKNNLGKEPPQGMTLMEQYNQGYVNYDTFMKLAKKKAREKNKRAFAEIRS